MTTAGFVADQLTWDKQQQTTTTTNNNNHSRCFSLCLYTAFFSLIGWLLSPFPSSTVESFNDWGGWGCRKFVPVFGGDGTKNASPGDIFDQPLGKWVEFRASLPTCRGLCSPIPGSCSGNHRGDGIVVPPLSLSSAAYTTAFLAQPAEEEYCACGCILFVCLLFVYFAFVSCFSLLRPDLVRDRKRRSKTKNGVFRSGFFDQKKKAILCDRILAISVQYFSI